jgi:hypothetical protein
MVVECPVAVPLASISPPALAEETRRRDDSGRGRRRVGERGTKRDDVGTLNAAADETHHAPIMSPGLIAWRRQTAPGGRPGAPDAAFASLSPRIPAPVEGLRAREVNIGGPGPERLANDGSW